MQVCFKELNVPFVNESEMFDCAGYSGTIKFRSWFERNGNLAEILAFVFPSQDIILLTMNFYRKFGDLDKSTICKLFNLQNAVNNSNPTFYWVFYEITSKLEFRTAYYLAESRLNEIQFKSLLRKLIRQGPLYYSYFRRLIDNNESLSKLSHEIQLEAL
jgi:hypothetical protein